MNKFEQYVLENYKDKLKSIARDGCETAKVGRLGFLYDEFANELHQMLAEYLEIKSGLIPKGLCNALKAEHTFKNYITCCGLHTVAHRFVNPHLYKEYQEYQEQSCA